MHSRVKKQTFFVAMHVSFHDHFQGGCFPPGYELVSFPAKGFKHIIPSTKIIACSRGVLEWES